MCLLPPLQVTSAAIKPTAAGDDLVYVHAQRRRASVGRAHASTAPFFSGTHGSQRPPPPHLDYGVPSLSLSLCLPLSLSLLTQTRTRTPIIIIT